MSTSFVLQRCQITEQGLWLSDSQLQQHPVNTSADLVGSEWLAESLHVRCTCRAWQMFLEITVSELIDSWQQEVYCGRSWLVNMECWKRATLSLLHSLLCPAKQLLLKANTVATCSKHCAVFSYLITLKVTLQTESCCCSYVALDLFKRRDKTTFGWFFK